MKKLLAILTVFFITTGFAYSPNSQRININSVAGVVIDQDSGRVLYSKNGDKRLAMASTTKIITAMVAIDSGNLKDTVIVSKRAAAVSGSTAGLKEGEKVSLEELVYGLMLRSGNDAAIAIAEHIGGDVDGFIRLMNEKAVEYGALNTSFRTPHGLDAEDHYTTAEDLARITAHAMRNGFFAKVAATKEISSGVSGEFNRSYSNINKFLFRVDNSDGVKTGYTGNAGKCLVASVKHEHGRYICVVLNSGDRWKDAEKLAKYADDNYKFVKVFDKNEPLKRLKVYGGNEKYIVGKVQKDLYIPLKSDEMEKYSVEVFAPSVIFSPLKANEIVGNVVVKLDDKIIAKYQIESDREVKRKNFINIVKEMINF